jgi:AcrR family transcriptional regulator
MSEGYVKIGQELDPIGVGGPILFLKSARRLTRMTLSSKSTQSQVRPRSSFNPVESRQNELTPRQRRGPKLGARRDHLPDFILARNSQIKAFGASKTQARRVLDAYFSLDHFDDRERCCLLIGLPSEASRGNGDVKEAYREVVEKLLQIFQAERDRPKARERALVLIALCVGGMVLARGVDGPVLADDIRAAAHRQALRVRPEKCEAVFR